MNQYFTRDCWDFRDELARKYPRVTLLHGLLGVRAVALSDTLGSSSSWPLQSKQVQVWDVKAMHNIFIKEQDFYEEPVGYVFFILLS